MVEAEIKNERGIAHGVTQWDYGQILHITGESLVDGTEVNFYQKELSSLGYLKNNCVAIPDIMLQKPHDITVYIYVRDSDSGETILIIWIPVTYRPRPDNYVLPAMEEYKRLLPVGGDSGQVPVKASDVDYAVIWGYRADGLSYDGEYMQLMSGQVPIGERVRLISSAGREIELTNDGEYIKWRYTDSNEWNNLASLDSLKGPPGVTPEFEVRDGHLIVKYVQD